MVVFTCQHCGDSITKPKVEKHYNTRCRFKTPNLTCVDCLKDFFDKAYNAHNECVSEEQRYAAKGTIVKECTGKNKQLKYVEMIQNLLNTVDLTNNQRKLLKVCSEHQNVPRKLTKFCNFLNNSARHVKYKTEDVDSVFKILEDSWKTITTPKDPPKSTSENKNKLTKDVGNEEHKELEIGDISINDNSVPKKKKKKNVDEDRRLIIDDLIVKNDFVNEHTKENLIDEAIVENNNVDEHGNENLNGISRKELKKLKKYEKYIKELENESKTENENVDHNGSIDEIKQKQKKKSKKLKEHCSNSDQQQLRCNAGGESEQAMEVVSEEKCHKKSKKRKMDDAICDTTEKKQKKIPAEEDEVATFDWTDVIVRVLEGRPDKELSLKRLSKKVINEYQCLKKDHKTYEELSAKFNKKIKKTQGVRVLKDKAKLIQ